MANLPLITLTIFLLLSGCSAQKRKKLVTHKITPIITSPERDYEMKYEEQDAGNSVISVKLPNGNTNSYRTIITRPKWTVNGSMLMTEFLNIKDTLEWINKYNERRKYDYIKLSEDKYKKIPSLLGPKKIISHKIGTAVEIYRLKNKVIYDTVACVTLELMPITLYNLYLRDLNYEKLYQDTRSLYTEDPRNVEQPKIKDLLNRYPGISTLNRFSREELSNFEFTKKDTCLSGDCANGMGELLYGGHGLIISQFKNNIPYGSGVWVDIPNKYYRTLSVIEGTFDGFKLTEGTLYLSDIAFCPDKISLYIEPSMIITGQLNYDNIPLKSAFTITPKQGNSFYYDGKTLTSKVLSAKELIQLAIINLYGSEGEIRIKPDYMSLQIPSFKSPDSFPFKVKLTINNNSDLSEIQIDRSSNGDFIYSIVNEDYWAENMRKKIYEKNYFNQFKDCFLETTSFPIDVIPYENKIGTKNEYGEVSVVAKKIDIKSSKNVTFETTFNAWEWLGTDDRGRDVFNKGTNTYVTQKKEEISYSDIYQIECRCNGQIVASFKANSPLSFTGDEWLEVSDTFKGPFSKTISKIKETIQIRSCKFWSKENLDKAKVESNLVYQKAQKLFDQKDFTGSINEACKALKIREDNEYYSIMLRALEEGVKTIKK